MSCGGSQIQFCANVSRMFDQAKIGVIPDRAFALEFGARHWGWTFGKCGEAVRTWLRGEGRRFCGRHRAGRRGAGRRWYILVGDGAGRRLEGGGREKDGLGALVCDLNVEG